MPIIFVVDDDALLRLVAVELLSDAGFETLEAADADTAFGMMQDCWPEVAVLFTDVQMPGHMDGIDLATEVNRCWPDVGLVVSSAQWSACKDRLPAEARFLPKPYTSLSMLDSIRQVMGPVRPAA